MLPEVKYITRYCCLHYKTRNIAKLHPLAAQALPANLAQMQINQAGCLSASALCRTNTKDSLSQKCTLSYAAATVTLSCFQSLDKPRHTENEPFSFHPWTSEAEKLSLSEPKNWPVCRSVPWISLVILISFREDC